MIFVKQRMGTNNTKRSGFETLQKRIDDLGNLVVKYPYQPLIVPTEVSAGVYEVDLTQTVLPYLFLVNAYAVVQPAEDCELHTPLKFVQHDDINETLRDPFVKKNKEYIPYNFGRNSTNSGTSLYIYTSKNITGVALEYVKYPARVSLGTYPYINGVTYPQNTLETAEHTHREIVDLACQLAAQNTQNPEYIQIRNQKLLINE